MLGGSGYSLRPDGATRIPQFLVGSILAETIATPETGERPYVLGLGNDDSSGGDDCEQCLGFAITQHFDYGRRY
jgi:hypothetical protein